MGLTPRQIHRKRILAVLSEDPSGSCLRSEVLERLAVFQWSKEDEVPRGSRPWETKWENRASYERAEMVRDKLLIEDDTYGHWTLSEAGWTLARATKAGEHLGHGAEYARRESLWQSVTSDGGPADVSPALIRRLGLYAGARGIYVNKERTKTATEPSGIAVSFLHTGRSYADDLSETGVLYHYPQTRRPGHDKVEIAASKAAYRAGVPVFVIGPGSRATNRTLYRGYIERFDDSLSVLLITFTEGLLPPAPPANEEDAPFSLIDPASRKTYSLRENRPNQARFAMKVFQRYGTSCAVCQIDVYGLVQAAHLRAKKHGGSDDERNALPLCANHHLAFDKALWAIEPETLKVHGRNGSASLSDLGISRGDLLHLKHQPHKDAINDCWRLWEKTQAGLTNEPEPD